MIYNGGCKSYSISTCDDKRSPIVWGVSNGSPDSFAIRVAEGHGRLFLFLIVSYWVLRSGGVTFKIFDFKIHVLFKWL